MDIGQIGCVLCKRLYRHDATAGFHCSERFEGALDVQHSPASACWRRAVKLCCHLKFSIFFPFTICVRTSCYGTVQWYMDIVKCNWPSKFCRSVSRVPDCHVRRAVELHCRLKFSI